MQQPFSSSLYVALQHTFGKATPIETLLLKYSNKDTTSNISQSNSRHNKNFLKATHKSN